MGEKGGSFIIIKVKTIYIYSPKAIKISVLVFRFPKEKFPSRMICFDYFVNFSVLFSVFDG